MTEHNLRAPKVLLESARAIESRVTFAIGDLRFVSV